jgi:tRNA (guanine37-N1)-methyltransferase
MLSIRTPRRKAADAVKILKSSRLLAETTAKHSDSYVYFNINSTDEKVKKLLIEHGAEIVRKVPPGLGRKLYINDRDPPKSGYEALGNIAIIDSSIEDKKSAAESILSTNKSIRTVMSKAGAVKGEYRLRSFSYVLGERTFMADYTENGCRFVFDIRRTFFSGKLSFERSRICSIAKDGENVIVMFAGVGPFAIEIAKRHRRSNVVAIELNAAACRYLRKNIALNKLDNVVAVEEDAASAAKNYKGYADRIVMPLPKDALSFLGAAFLAAKKGAMVHVYSFGKRESAFAEAREAIERSASAAGSKSKIVFQRKVRDYSAGDIEVVTDFVVM